MLAPHAGKNFPTLAEYVTGGQTPARPPQTAAQIAAVMRGYGAGGAIKRTYPPGYDGPP